MCGHAMAQLNEQTDTSFVLASNSCIMCTHHANNRYARGIVPGWSSCIIDPASCWAAQILLLRLLDCCTKGNNG